MAERFTITYHSGRYYVSIPSYNGGEVVDAASFDAMVKALRDIAAIEDKYEGTDWEEIEEARKIANDALAGVVGGVAK